MAYNRELNNIIQVRQENEEIHLEYNDENYFYDQIANGNIAFIKEATAGPYDENTYEAPGYGHLSDNPLQNAKYHVAISIALVTRHCISHGLEHELAYSLSDVYIQKTDKQTTIREVLMLHSEMLMDFTKRMAELPKKDAYSLQTVQAINYVCAHYAQDINVESVANALKINRSYLSKIFMNDTGYSLSSYIRNERIKAAGNMLRFSNYSASQIAEYLHFSSQSHFIQCFKAETGVTPSDFRRQMAAGNGIRGTF